jgi:diadenosine tetraphosphatase ApaH/serine/threonine PP2A family protein phosphatase
MKLALFADVHANLEALSACLAHAREQGADRLAFLGDLVGYGADPGPVVDLVAEQAGRGAFVVRGNHDQAVVSPSDTMNPAAERAVAWTRERLDEGQRGFLARLPLVARHQDIFFVHASAEAPERWIYITDPVRAGLCLGAAGTPYVFCGHVHEPRLWFAGPASRPIAFRPVPGVAIPVAPHRRWLAIVGAAGQPRDGNTAASYALLETEHSRLTFFRVPYDWSAAAAKVRAAGLPESLARRLEHGE